MLTITIKLKGAIRHDADANVFISYCPTLKLYSQGRNDKDARKALKSAVFLYLTTCLDRGILERTLKELGFATSSGPISLRQYADEFIQIEEANFEEAFDFDVPIHLVAAQQSTCQP